MSMVEELKAVIAAKAPWWGYHAHVVEFIEKHGQALVEAVDQNEALWELVCWNIDNFRDLPLTDGYYAKWLDKAEALLARTKVGAGGGA